VVGQLTAETLSLVGGCTDATKDVRRLAERADRQPVDRFSALAAVRWRLAGQLDHQPDSLVALVALGIAALAALEPGDELEGRNDITRR
jgi:hypothetical protein